MFLFSIIKPLASSFSEEKSDKIFPKTKASRHYRFFANLTIFTSLNV